MPTYYGWDTAPIAAAPAAFEVIGATNILTSVPGNLTWPVGTQVGDMGIIVAVGNRNIVAPDFPFATGTYTMGAAAAGRMTTYTSILGSTAAVPVSVSSGTWVGHIYGIVIRDVSPATAIAVETPIGGVNATSTTLTGFSKSLDSRVLLCITSRNNTDGDVTGPAGWTPIVSSNTSYSSIVSYLSASDYTNNSDIVAGLGAGSNNGGATVFEYTGV